MISMRSNLTIQISFQRNRMPRESCVSGVGHRTDNMKISRLKQQSAGSQKLWQISIATAGMKPGDSIWRFSTLNRISYPNGSEFLKKKMSLQSDMPQLQAISNKTPSFFSLALKLDTQI